MTTDTHPKQVVVDGGRLHRRRDGQGRRDDRPEHGDDALRCSRPTPPSTRRARRARSRRRSSTSFNELIVDGCDLDQRHGHRARERARRRRPTRSAHRRARRGLLLDLAEQMAADAEGTTKVARDPRERRARATPTRARAREAVAEQPAREDVALRRRPLLGAGRLRARLVWGGVRPRQVAVAYGGDASSVAGGVEVAHDALRVARAPRRARGRDRAATSASATGMRARAHHRPRPRLHRREHEDLVTRDVDAGAHAPAVLVEAIPYIRRFAGKVVVVKYGGNALAGGDRRARRGAARASPRTSC